MRWKQENWHWKLKLRWNDCVFLQGQGHNQACSQMWARLKFSHKTKIFHFCRPKTMVSKSEKKERKKKALCLISDFHTFNFLQSNFQLPFSSLIPFFSLSSFSLSFIFFFFPVSLPYPPPFHLSFPLASSKTFPHTFQVGDLPSLIV